MRAHDAEAAFGSGRPARLFSLRCRPPCKAAPAARARGSARLELTVTGGILASCLALACSELTAPPAHRRGANEPATEVAAAPPPPETQVITEKIPAPEPADQIECSHILVSYQGATRAKPTVTRTREEARELATKLATKAREPGVDFAQLAKDASDGPSGVEGGVLPRFGRQQMVKPFSDAAFALRPGEVSGVVETNFGFHVIRRNP
jgi:peptidyl-prolyl cis-trans isomerase NIMA-interacting 1